MLEILKSKSPLEIAIEEFPHFYLYPTISKQNLDYVDQI